MRILFLLLLLSGCAAMQERRAANVAARAVAAEQARIQAEIEQEQERANVLAEQLDIRVPEFVHLGRDLSAEVNAPSSLEIQTSKAPTDTVGTFEWVVEARYKRGKVIRRVPYQVVSPEGSPWFPLEQGNRWVYDYSTRTRKRTGTFLFFIPIRKTVRSRVDKAFLKIEILEKVSLPTHDEYQGRITHKENHKDVRFLAKDGHTYIRAENQWIEFIEVPTLPDAEAFAHEPLTCHIRSLELEECECNARPSGESFAPAGPEQCKWVRRSSSGAKNDVAESIIFGVLTAGLFVPHTGKSTRVETVELASHKRPALGEENLDRDPYLLALGTSKYIKDSTWHRTWKKLQAEAPIHIDIAAALYQKNQNDEERQQTILISLKDHPDRQRMLRLAPSEIERFTLSATLDLPTTDPFGAEIYRQRERIISVASAVSLVSEVQEKYPLDSFAQPMLCTVLPDDTLRLLHQGLSQTWSEAQREEWATNCSRKKEKESAESRTRFELGLPLDPFVHALLARVRYPTERSIPPVVPELVKQHPLTTETAQILMRFGDAFFHKRKILASLEPHLSMTQKQAILGSFDRSFDKKWVVKALQLDKEEP